MKCLSCGQMLGQIPEMKVQRKQQLFHSNDIICLIIIQRKVIFILNISSYKGI